jgi:hypothetical protein
MVRGRIPVELQASHFVRMTLRKNLMTSLIT